MTKVKEIWKEVPNVKGLEISNYGNAREFRDVIVKRYRYRSINKFMQGDYYNICYKGRVYALHVLVATLHVPNPDNLPQVNHKKGNKLDNRAWMLEWCTSQYNTYHAIYELGHVTNFGRKKVRVLKGGNIVCEKPTVSEAARFAGGQSTQVSRVLLGTRTHYKGYTFQFIE